MKPGVSRTALIDVVDDVEGGRTLCEAFAKHPKCFDRLYVNMVKAGEAGGALEVILQRLADFKEKAQSLKRQIKAAMVYPVVVIMVAVGILTFIMIFIIPKFEKIFKDFKSELPTITSILIDISHAAYDFWYVIPLFPSRFWLFIKLLAQFNYGRVGWDRFKLKMPIIGQLVEKNTVARTMRTLGTLISSGVPILEALNIVRETSGNAVFEKLYQPRLRLDPRRRDHRPAAQGILAGQLQRHRPLVLGDFHPGLRRPDVRPADESAHRRRHRRQHGRRRRGDGRAGHDALQDRRHLRRRSRRAHRKPHQADRAAVDHLPRRGGRVHRGRAVHAAGRADHQPHRRQRRRAEELSTKYEGQRTKQKSSKDTEHVQPSSTPSRRPFRTSYFVLRTCRRAAAAASPSSSCWSSSRSSSS